MADKFPEQLNASDTDSDVDNDDDKNELSLKEECEIGESKE